ncbi:MAG: dTDP-4-dehydrorhamnose 3,5-epimerase family protein [Bacteroidales bacterium]|nr:dTDP-4-dehydrorhamnose 3,5-epimerase family protein [Bacteroidales bacterium]
MNKICTEFEGLYILETNNFHDERGSFQKLFNKSAFIDLGLDCDFCEFYYSVNNKNVVRGMHFQAPPYEHSKVVYVSKGKIIDVVVDIRKNSKTYGKCFSVELDDISGRYIYMPKGFAHGFKSLENNSIVNYAQTSCYNRECDCGIDSMKIGYDWKIENPIRSVRDQSFVSLEEFRSPF